MTTTSSNSFAAGDTPSNRMTGASEKSEPLVLLDDSIAADPALVGGKAATLARARAAGLPTLPGVVVTMRVDVASLASDPARLSALLREHLGDGPLIARSSSSVEDSPQHSMAGRFDTIAGVNEDHEIADAVLAVVRSAERVAAEDQLDEVPPIAVLVQPMVDPRFGGVCFGVEPVTGRIDRKFAVVSTSGPDAVVSGRVAGVRHLLDGQGRLLRRDGDDDWEANLDRRRRRELTSLMDRLAALFGGPQDVEFLEDRQGELILLQSRPVTTELRGTPSGPVYGTGPVAETFPERLSALEQDLWVPPLRDGLREALKVTAMASRSDLRQRPLVVVNDGRVAIDLQMVGALPAGPRWRGWFAVRPQARRARATWRVGQLRAALPALARDLVGTADEALAGAGSLGELSDRQLVGLLQRGRTALRSLHGHEVLIGLLSDQATSNLTGLSVALRALVAARQQGLDDAEIIARSPVVLALTGPRIDGVALPEGAPALPPPLPAEATGDEAAILREALRIRIRWVQELTARAARELGTRLHDRGLLRDPLAVSDLGFDDVAALGTGAAVARRDASAACEPIDRNGARLPARFQFDADGRVVAATEPGGGHGVGAGGGAGSGPVTLDADAAAPGSVLVVADLRPSLAPVIGHLAGLVAESGSPLAHVAILAREAAVPTVVGLTAATTTFREGQFVEVDGDAGVVRRCAKGSEPGPDQPKTEPS